ncbi:MAG: type II secretion system F family protein [Ignisphaera sp.]
MRSFRGGKLDVGYFIGLAVSLFVLVSETVLLVLNIDLVKVNSISEFISNALKFSLLCSYIMTLFGIPALISWSSDAARNIVNLYRRYSIMSLTSLDESKIRVGINVLFVVISISLFMVILSIIYRTPILSIASFVPLFVFIFILMKPVIDVKHHSSSVDAELKWFMILLLVVEYVGSGIDFLVKKISRSNLLRHISRELSVIKRDALLYFQSYVEAIIQRAKTTPSEKLKRILLGYAMRLREGGDVVAWLKTVLGEELIKWEWETKIYSERVALIVLQIAIAVFVLLPTLVVAIPIISWRIAIMAVILATPLLCIIAYATRPKSLNRISSSMLLTPLIVLGVTSSLLFIYIGSQGIVLGWIIASIASINVNKQLKEIETLDRESLEILKMAAELKKHGYEIPRALSIIANSTSISAKTSRLLKHINSIVESGHGFDEAIAVVSSPSFQFNFVLLLLGLMYESGGGDEEAIQTVYEYLYRYKAYESNIKKASYIFEFFAVANLAIILWVWRTLHPMFASNILQFVAITLLPNSAIALIIVVSLIGYSLVSSIIRSGFPVIDAVRSIPLALLASLVISFL